MNKIILLLNVSLFLFNVSRSQTVTPALSNEYCPNVDITFAVSIVGVNPQVNAHAFNVVPTVT